MPRFAILWERLGDRSQPVGLAIHRGDHVLVELPDEYGVRRRFDGDYRVMQPDATRVAYRPVDEGYFDQVLLDLSSSFAVGLQATVDEADLPTISRLLAEHVFEPRHESRIGEYAFAGSRGRGLYVRCHTSPWARAAAVLPADPVSEELSESADSEEVARQLGSADSHTFTIAA